MSQIITPPRPVVVVIANALSGLLAFVFAGGSVGKLTSAKSQVATAEKLHIDWRRYRYIAIPEAAAAVGLLLGLVVAPLGAAAAIGVALLMLSAAFIRVMRHDAIPFVIGDLTICALAIAVAVLRVTG
jgi:hypothetical protein